MEYRARNLAKALEYRAAYRERERELEKARNAGNPEPRRESSRKWREKNPEKVKAKNAAIYAADPVGNKARVEEWRRANPDKVRERAKEWSAANSEKVIRWRAESARRWAKKFPERKAAAVRLYQASRRQAVPPWADRKAMLAFYAEARRLTLETGMPHHVDHIIPINHPLVCGLHVETNLQVLPAKANISKGNRLPTALSA